MQEAELRSLVGDAYTALADRLDRAPEDRWDTASLCAGWRVREVVAHVTMPARYDEPTFMAELAARDFDFTRLSNDLATRDAMLPVAGLVANLRDRSLHEWSPPGGGVEGALSHVVIHGLDITAPTGEPPTASTAALAAVLDTLARGGVHEQFGTDIAGRRLEATDRDWAYGEGAPLRGSTAELILHLTGRTVMA